METLIACINAAGLTEKRPPHMDCPEAGAGCAGLAGGDWLMGGVPGGRDEGRTRRGGLAFAIGVAVLIGGAAAIQGGNLSAVITRLTQNGQIDSSFGNKTWFLR